MNTNMSAPKKSLAKRAAAALLMGGGIAIAGLGLASGTAQADPGPQDHQPPSYSQDHQPHSWYSEFDHQWYWCWFDFFNWCWHYSPYQP